MAAAPIGKPENPESTVLYMLFLSLGTNATYLRSGKASNGSRFELFVFCFASLSFCFVFVFMLSLEHCRCCFDFFMSSTPRTGLATAHVTGYVNARSVGVKNTCGVEFQ